MATKKDMLAELDLAGLLVKREEAVKMKEKADKRVGRAKVEHFAGFFASACALAYLTRRLAQAPPGNGPLWPLLVSVCGLTALWLAIEAFRPGGTVRQRRDEAAAAARKLKAIDDKIAFAHVVMEEARKVRARRYAEAWVEKELS
jgi:hypothetical protein